MQNYRSQRYWEKYQNHFPPHARITNETLPEEEWFEWRGNSIHLDRFANAESPLTIIMVHGAGGYGRLFAPIGLICRNLGYEVVAPDLPGYGLTSAKNAHINYSVWRELLCDLAIKEHKKNQKPVVLFGGSIGGYLAYLCGTALASKNIIAGIIATTLADPRLEITQAQFAKNKLIKNVGLPLLPLFNKLAGPLKLPIKWFTKMGAMSNNSTLSKIVAADPLGGGSTVPISFMNSIFQITPDIEPENFDHCPILLAHPEADRWTDIASSQVFYDKLNCEKSLVMLDNCGHFPIEQPGIGQLEVAIKAFLEKISSGLDLIHK